MSDLTGFLEHVIKGQGKPLWRKLFDKFGSYFDKELGVGWEERDKFFKEFQAELEGSLRKELCKGF
jgi:hypothetical protein